METLVWLRVLGDIVFAIGVVFLAVFAIRLSGKDHSQLVPVLDG